MLDVQPTSGAAAEDQPGKSRTAAAWTTMTTMAVSAKKLDVTVGDVVEIDDRRYDVVSDKRGGVALEPAITKTAAEILEEQGLKPMSREEFEEHFGHLRGDGDG